MGTLRFLGGVTLLICVGLAVCGVMAPRAVARGTLVADYQLEGSRYPSRPDEAPPLTDLGPRSNTFRVDMVDGQRRPVLSFPRGNGLMLGVGGLLPRSRYSIAVLFRLRTLAGYRRVLDTSAGIRDRGLYTFAHSLAFWPLVERVGSRIRPRRYSHVVMSRGRRGVLKVYLDGRLQFAFYDGRRAGVISEHRVLRFFRDNWRGASTSEHSGGVVARIRLYAGSLNQTQVRKLELDRAR